MIYTKLRPLPRVVHIRFTTQNRLCRSMIRMQEFYESPYKRIRGQYFTLEQFMSLYVRTHGAPFSYFNDWVGFNIPGLVLRDFAEKFASDMTPFERMVIGIKNMDYLIATHSDFDLTHEIAHALFFTNKLYRVSASGLVKSFEKNHPKEYAAIAGWLKHEGYDATVEVDEINAYLSTNNRRDFRKNFPKAMADTLYEIGGTFRSLFAAHYKSRK